MVEIAQVLNSVAGDCNGANYKWIGEFQSFGWKGECSRSKQAWSPAMSTEQIVVFSILIPATHSTPLPLKAKTEPPKMTFKF
jgi:hypothetical protein